jgi:hypothetical protein
MSSADVGLRDVIFNLFILRKKRRYMCFLDYDFWRSLQPMGSYQLAGRGLHADVAGNNVD